MKQIILILLVLLMPFCTVATAQTKKTISQAKQWVKEDKNLDQAESAMLKLLKDSANRENHKIWSILFDAQRKQYEQGNEKLYLKQKYDTATLFKVASRMFTSMEAYDSLEARPDKKGRINPEHRRGHFEQLNALRPNLFNGGLFFINKQNWKDAYHFFDQYIDTATQPLFEAGNYNENDKRLPEAAYWAVYSAYKMNDPQKVLHHTYLALKDTVHYKMMLQYLAATYRLEGDTTRFVSTLLEGFDRYPLSQYFFSNLIDHYSRQAKWEEALRLTDRALAVDSTSISFLLTKSSLLLNCGDYEQAYKTAKDILTRNDSLPEALLYAGLARFNQAVTLDKTTLQRSRRSRQVTNYYKEALPYLERYRSFCPDKKDKWSLPLYTIYLNLNMGKEFDEIDKLMKK